MPSLKQVRPAPESGIENAWTELWQGYQNAASRIFAKLRRLSSIRAQRIDLESLLEFEYNPPALQHLKPTSNPLANAVGISMQ